MAHYSVVLFSFRIFHMHYFAIELIGTVSYTEKFHFKYTYHPWQSYSRWIFLSPSSFSLLIHKCIQYLEYYSIVVGFSSYFVLSKVKYPTISLYKKKHVHRKKTSTSTTITENVLEQRATRTRNVHCVTTMKIKINK